MKDIDIVQNRSNRDLSGRSHLEAENVRQMLPARIFPKPSFRCGKCMKQCVCKTRQPPVFHSVSAFCGSCGNSWTYNGLMSAVVYGGSTVMGPSAAWAEQCSSLINSMREKNVMRGRSHPCWNHFFPLVCLALSVYYRNQQRARESEKKKERKLSEPLRGDDWLLTNDELQATCWTPSAFVSHPFSLCSAAHRAGPPAALNQIPVPLWIIANDCLSCLF